MFAPVRIFFNMRGRTQVTVLACLLLASLAQAFGIATMLPLLALISGGETATSPAAGMVMRLLDAIGLPATLGSLTAVIVAGVFLKAALVFLAMNHVGYAVADLVMRLRSRLIDGLLRVRWSYFTSQPVGRIANAVSLEAARAGQAYLVAAQVLATLIQAAVYIGLAFLVSWKVALVAIVIGGVVVSSLSRLIDMSRRAGRRERKHTSALVEQISDALVGIKPLKAMARHAQVARFLERKIRSLRRALRRQVLSQQLMRSLQEPMQVMCLVVGIYLAVTFWSTPVADLLVMAVLMERTVATVSRVQQQLQLAAANEASYWTMHRLIEEAEAAREPMTGSELPTLTQGCALRDVHFAFGDKPVLDGVSIEIPANQVTVITGASGTGKTTMTDLLLGLYWPDSGEVLVDGTPLERIDLQQWRSMIGYVPQELIMFHDTVLANVTLGDPDLSEEKARAALVAAGAWDFVASLPEGLHSTVGERGLKLSGGQRQRIALARALVHDPKLLILDEVTSALDPETEAEICRNIQDLAQQVTILAITHRPAWVDAADRVYRLGNDGTTLRASDIDTVEA